MLAAPEAHQFACLDKSTTRLLPVRCELWRGLVFINLDPDAAPLAEFMAPALTYTQGFPLEDLVLHGHFIIEFDCNWKMAYHNFLQAYHTRTRSEAPKTELQSLMRHSYDVFYMKQQNK